MRTALKIITLSLPSSEGNMLQAQTRLLEVTLTLMPRLFPSNRFKVLKERKFVIKEERASTFTKLPNGKLSSIKKKLKNVKIMESCAEQVSLYTAFLKLLLF